MRRVYGRKKSRVRLTSNLLYHLGGKCYRRILKVLQAKFPRVEDFLRSPKDFFK